MIYFKLARFEKGAQNRPKRPQKREKRGRKKNFHFADLDGKKWENHPFLRMQRAQGRRGLWSERGQWPSGKGGFHCVSPSWYTPDGVPEDDSRPAVVQRGEDRQLIGYTRLPQSIAGRAELAWYTLARALITGGGALLHPRLCS